MEQVDPPRPLTPWERRVIALLAPQAPVERIDALRVFERCACGCASVSFRPSVREHFLVGEAAAADSDGMTISLLLFGQNDELELDEIEIQRADGQPIIDLPDVGRLTVTQTSRWR